MKRLFKPILLSGLLASSLVLAEPVWVVATPNSASSSSPLDQTQPAASAVAVGARLYWRTSINTRGPQDYSVAAPGQVCDCSDAIVESNDTYCSLPQWPRRVVQCQVKQ